MCTCSHSISLPGDARLLSPRAMYRMPGCSRLRLENSTIVYFIPALSSNVLDSTTPCTTFIAHEHISGTMSTGMRSQGQLI